MLNQTAWWKYLVVLTVVVVGLFYALPNIFGSDPGIQIRGSRGLSIESKVLDRIQTTLETEFIDFKSISQDEKGIKIRFADDETQLRAKEIIEADLGNNYSSALTLLPGAPRWLTSTGASPMYLGLDLRGGVHFLLQVDMQSAVNRAQERFLESIKTTLRESKLRYRSVTLNSAGQLETTIRNPEQRQQAYEVLVEEIPGLRISNDEERPEIILAQLEQAQKEEIQEFALEQNLTALRNRVDQLGVAEPVVQRQGNDRIIIQLPGVQDTARAKTILGRAATLEMHLVDEKNTVSAVASGQAPAGSKLFRFRDGNRILLQKRVIYSGDNIIDAAASIDTQSGGPIVSMTLDSTAATINSRVTGENINNRMAVVYLELISEIKKDANGDIVLNEQGKPVRVTNRLEEVLTAPVIREQLGKRYQIEGLDSVEEARDLALMLRSGALAAPVEIIEERTVGPSLGKANISQGFYSVIVGFSLVLIFMLGYYRLFGLTATIALTLNLVLIVAVLSMLQATLTLPGVAGIVLTVGMAVDANVLIFERIREEIRNGNSPQTSIHLGYDRALSTIIDANITTLIAAVVLFLYGTGPIKGFAVTLSIGIATSMFTAIMVTRVLINKFYGGKTVKQLSI